MSDPSKSSMFVAQWLTKFAFHLNWLPFTMSFMSLNLRNVSKYPRRSLRPVPLRLNPIYLTSNNLFESWIPRKGSPEEGQLRCIKSYGIITSKKKQLGRQNLIFNENFQISFKPIPKSNHLILLSFRISGRDSF
jgi:hypothetical protein